MFKLAHPNYELHSALLFVPGPVLFYFWFANLQNLQKFAKNNWAWIPSVAAVSDHSHLRVGEMMLKFKWLGGLLPQVDFSLIWPGLCSLRMQLRITFVTCLGLVQRAVPLMGLIRELSSPCGMCCASLAGELWAGARSSGCSESGYVCLCSYFYI